MTCRLREKLKLLAAASWGFWTDVRAGDTEQQKRAAFRVDGRVVIESGAVIESGHVCVWGLSGRHESQAV